MIQVTPQMRILVAVEPADFRCGIDGLCGLCRRALGADVFSGTVFVFRNRRSTAVKILAYDGQGFWLCQKRLSKNRFRYWPTANGHAQRELLAHELQVLLAGGNPETARAVPQWRPVTQSAANW
jgi:transposase